MDRITLVTVTLVFFPSLSLSSQEYTVLRARFGAHFRYATVVNEKRAADSEYTIWLKSGLQCNSLNGIRGRNFGVPRRDKSSPFSSDSQWSQLFERLGPPYNVHVES